MYIEYSYRPADNPDGVNNIAAFKINMVKDLVDAICNYTPPSGLSNNCMASFYYGTESGWELDEILDDYRISIKSKSTDDHYKKYVIISTALDTSTNASGFATTTDPLSGTVTYSEKSTAQLFLTFETYDFNPVSHNNRRVEQSVSSIKFYYYASGGTIRITCSEHHLIFSGHNDDYTKSQNGIGVTDFESLDDLDNSYSKIVFFDTKNWNTNGPAYGTLVQSSKDHSKVYSSNEYDVEIYDLDGNINFYNPSSTLPDKKYFYANHVYVNRKIASNYMIGGDCSKLSNVFVLPKNNIGKPLEEIKINGKIYVVWSMLPNDFTVNNNRLLILKE